MFDLVGVASANRILLSLSKLFYTLVVFACLRFCLRPIATTSDKAGVLTLGFLRYVIVFLSFTLDLCMFLRLFLGLYMFSCSFIKIFHVIWLPFGGARVFNVALIRFRSFKLCMVQLGPIIFSSFNAFASSHEINLFQL